MSMSVSTRRFLLSGWIKPSSDNEKTQQDRAERMVREAIKASDTFDGSDIKIYTKGSYPNNTNVRRDSDVDVVVELQDCVYFDYLPGQTPAARSSEPYSGPWTPATWRSAVQAALIDSFRASRVSAGKVAINISAVSASRPSADVVPSFDYLRYDDPFRQTVHNGSCVFPSDGGEKIINWPDQQLQNGRMLNSKISGRYKYYVRALKNAENTLAAAGTMTELPSYFMECLVYNTPIATLQTGGLDAGFRATLYHLWATLRDGAAYDSWTEPNELKWLFKGQQKWTVDDAKDLVQATWNYLGYGS